MSPSSPPAADHKCSRAITRFWEEGRGPESGDEFSILAAMTIGMAARNAVEELHVEGAFSDKQAPALNRRLRNRAYEVLLVVQLLGETGHDDRLADFLAVCAALEGQTGEAIDPISAMRGAIRTAVRDFADAEQLSKATADELEAAAVDGATNAFKALQSLDTVDSAKEVSYLASLIPGYWELPAPVSELRELLGLLSDE